MTVEMVREVETMMHTKFANASFCGQNNKKF